MRAPTRLLSAALILGSASLLAAADKELNTTEHFPAEPGTRLVVDVSTLDVFVRTADVRAVEVSSELRIAGVSEERADRWITQHTPSFEHSTDRIDVVAAPGRSGFLGLGLLTARAQLRMVCPRSVVPDLTTTRGSIGVRGDFLDPEPVRFRTASGDVEFSGGAHAIDIRTASGDSHIEVTRPLENCFARSSSGDLTLIGGSRTTHVDTSSGNVRLVNLSGSLEVETSTGKVTARWDRIDPEHTIKVRTASGRITIVLPPGASPRGTLTTADGSIRSGFPGVVNEGSSSVTLKGTGPLLTVETISGEIVLSPDES